MTLPFECNRQIERTNLSELRSTTLTISGVLLLKLREQPVLPLRIVTNLTEMLDVTHHTRGHPPGIDLSGSRDARELVVATISDLTRAGIVLFFVR